MKIPTLLLLVLFFFSACNDDETLMREKLYGTWEATTFISVESANYAKKDGYNPVITFKADGNYGLKLDMNSCGGSFRVTNYNQLNIDPPFCTKICCDSDFSQKIATILHEVSLFTFVRGNLRLHIDGWGYIVLEKKY
jgi:hypothetical protein